MSLLRVKMETVSPLLLPVPTRQMRVDELPFKNNLPAVDQPPFTFAIRIVPLTL